MAWVGVNMRGTGCSGGAYNFFENLQALDGYDAIETVAAQPWSTGRVGMVGISFAGISQLFVARTQPPHLAAITPLSVIDDTWRGTLYPGGIYNDGFAKGWAEERLEQNKWPNPDAPGWVKERIAGGDTVVRGQHEPAGPERRPARADRDSTRTSPRSTRSSATTSRTAATRSRRRRSCKDITAPVFIVGAWQDEQTGGRWANLLEPLLADDEGPGGRPERRAHRVARPDVLAEMVEFLDFYVAQKVPTIPPFVRGSSRPRSGQSITGVPGLTHPARPLRPVHGLRRGAGRVRSGSAGAHQLGGRQRARGRPRRAGARGARPATRPGRSRTRRRRPGTSSPAAGLGTKPASGHGRRGARPLPRATPRPDRAPATPAAAAASGPRTRRTTGSRSSTGSPSRTSRARSRAPSPMAGTGSVDLWVASNRRDADLQVTLSEVRPDGTERYVQNGWLRAQPPQARPRALDRARAVPHRHRGGRPADAPSTASCGPGCRSSRSRTRSGPGARSGSRSRHRAATGRCGRSTPRPDGRRATVKIAHDRRHPSRVVLPGARR